jgi:putative membrane protein
LIIPGIDSATMLSALGLYEIYLISIDTFHLLVLLPAGIGLLFGTVIISFGMKQVLKTNYTLFFSIIFGLFVSIIPSVIGDAWVLTFSIDSGTCIGLMLLGFIVSYYLGKK